MAGDLEFGSLPRKRSGPPKLRSQQRKRGVKHKTITAAGMHVSQLDTLHCAVNHSHVADIALNSNLNIPWMNTDSPQMRAAVCSYAA